MNYQHKANQLHPRAPEGTWSIDAVLGAPICMPLLPVALTPPRGQTRLPGEHGGGRVTLFALLILGTGMAALYGFGATLAALAGACALVSLALFRLNRQRSAAAVQANRAVQARLNDLICANAQTLRQGSEGEAAVEQAVVSILTDMGVPFWLPRHNGVENSVLLPTAPGRLSREIDCLVVCPFGVYVIEVKHWALQIGAHEDPSKLKVQRPSGQSESARSAPLYKTISKARELCLNLPRDLPWRALVVFSNPAGSLDAKLAADYVSIADLRHFFRQERDRAQKVFSPVEIGERLLGKFDRRVDAKHRHMMALPALGKDGHENADIARYQRNDREIKQLQSKPAASYTPRYRARWWLAVGCLFLSGATWAHWAAQSPPSVELTAGPVQQAVAKASPKAPRHGTKQSTRKSNSPNSN